MKNRVYALNQLDEAQLNDGQFVYKFSMGSRVYTGYSKINELQIDYIRDKLKYSIPLERQKWVVKEKEKEKVTKYLPENKKVILLSQLTKLGEGEGESMKEYELKVEDLNLQLSFEFV